MPAVIGCDAHKQFSVFVEIDSKGKTSPPVRVDHNRQQYIDFLHGLPPGSGIALEATGHWYWMVNEMEKAGHRPHLANPTEAKKRMGKTNKTDALDAKGLSILLHNGTLPESWIPSGELRNRRDPRAARLAGDRGCGPLPASRKPRQLCGARPPHPASGGRIRHGGTCRNVNHYLKCGFVEAATCAMRIKAYRGTHIDLFYHRLAPGKGHGRAIVAVARHLAEASFWVLRKQQPYKTPGPQPAISDAA